MSDIDLKPGTLLIAAPTLVDPNFRRAIILLCDHNSDGSFGLVINRRLDATLSDVVEDFDDFDGPLSVGGPVQTDTLHYLHQALGDVPDAVHIMDNVHWGGSFESVRVMMKESASVSQNLRFFLGYAGWGPGQLAAEIDQGGWVLTEGRAEDVFSDDLDSLWRTVLRRMGGEYAILANFPEDPRMN